MFGGGTTCAVAGADDGAGVVSGSTFSNIGDEAACFGGGGEGFVTRGGGDGGNGATVVVTFRSCTGAVTALPGAGGAIAVNARALKTNS